MWNASFFWRVCRQHTHSVIIKYFNLISSSSTLLHYWKENYIDQSFIQFIIAAININQRPVCPRTVLIIRGKWGCTWKCLYDTAAGCPVQLCFNRMHAVLLKYLLNIIAICLFFPHWKLWKKREGKSVFSSCCHSRKKAVGRLKFCSIYFFCRHHHRPAAVSSLSCLRLTVFHYLRCNICHGFWDPLSHFCSGVSIYGPTRLLFQI